TRPEPVVMFLGIAAFRLADHVRGRAPIAKLRQEALWVVPFVFIYDMFIMWRLSYYGSIFPNTYYAKVAGDTGQTSKIASGLTYLLRFVSDLNLLSIVIVSVLPLILFCRAARHYMLIASMLAPYLAAVIYSGGDWMPGFRYVVPLIPLMALMFQGRLIALVTSLSYRYKAKRL